MTHIDPKTIGEVFANAESDQRQYLVDPSLGVVSALVTAMTGEDSGSFPPVRILLRDDTVSTIRQHFPLASRLQQLIESDRVALRAGIERHNTVLVSESALRALVVIDEAVMSFSSEGQPDLTSLFAEIEELWETAEASGLRTASLSAARELASERLGETFRQQFDRAVAWAEGLSDPTGFDVVQACLTIGAAEEQLHYDVTKWGENAGVASKATFSRKKRQLEERGVIRTEDVSSGMGAPRQRLLLAAEYRERYEEDGLDALLAMTATTGDIDVE